MQGHAASKRKGKYSIKEKMKKERLKTICTLDSYYNDSIDYLNSTKENRSRNTINNFNQTRKSNIQKKSSHQKSHTETFTQSRYRQYTPSTHKKKTISISKDQRKRVKTQYHDYEQSNIKFLATEIRKKLLFLPEEKSKVDTYQIIKKIQSNDNQQVLCVNMCTYNQIKLIIKLKNSSLKRQYQLDMKKWQELSNKLKGKDKDYFVKIDKVCKQKKEWIVVSEQYHHVSWRNDKDYLFVSQFKNNDEMLNMLVKEMTKMMNVMSEHGYAHSNICLEALYFKVTGKGKLHYKQCLKLGNLRSMFKIRNKSNFLKMPFLYRTPPEIVNYILFQMGQEFDRQTLQYIELLDEGWKIDMWQLGILIVELLNGGPLDNQQVSGQLLMQLQRQLPIRYSYILDNMNPNLRSLLNKMLSFDPKERPHPSVVLKSL